MSCRLPVVHKMRDAWCAMFPSFILYYPSYSRFTTTLPHLHTSTCIRECIMAHQSIHSIWWFHILKQIFRLHLKGNFSSQVRNLSGTLADYQFKHILKKPAQHLILKQQKTSIIKCDRSMAEALAVWARAGLGLASPCRSRPRKHPNLLSCKA